MVSTLTVRQSLPMTRCDGIRTSRKACLRSRGGSVRRRCRRLGVELLEQRQLLTSTLSGAAPQDLGEFFLGSTTVTAVFFESNGVGDVSTEDWTLEQIEETKAKVETGVRWWGETLAQLNSVHTLDFVFDFTFADNPVETVFEPIERISNDFTLWGSEFLIQAGYSTTPLTFADHMVEFNHAQRVQHDTDWAFTIFVANSAQDENDSWAVGGDFERAFAFPQQKFMVVPSGRPASTVAHETGHMFWALDEYAGGGSAAQSRGYYLTPNENAADNPPQVDSIMADEAGVPGSLLENAYAAHVSSPSSLAMIGWQDSDGDGIFDVLDVPHRLDGAGFFDSSSQTYRFQGTSSVGTLPNRNPLPTGASSGSLQNDLTLNRITHVEYRLDGTGPFQDVGESYDSTMVELDLAIFVPADFESIEIRTRDARTGVTSPVFWGTPAQPTATTYAGLSGFVRHDANGNGSLESQETVGLAGWTVVLNDAQGNPLNLRQEVEPDDFPTLPAELNTIHAQVTLTAFGSGVLDTTVLSRTRDPAATGERVFAHRLLNGVVSTEWTQTTRRLRMDFTDPVNSVSLEAVALGDGKRGRLEIYDENDQLLGRYTTASLTSGEIETMTLERSQGDIAYALARAHQGSSIGLDHLQFGTETTATTDVNGVFSFACVPAGDYTLQLLERPDFLITTATSYPLSLQSGEIRENLDFGAEVTVSTTWQNPQLRYDIDGDGQVAPIDAILIVNLLNRKGSHLLPIAPTGATAPPPFYDTNGDGYVAAIDVLLVLNFLNGGGLLGLAEAEVVSSEVAASVATSWQDGEGEATLGTMNLARRALLTASTGESEHLLGSPELVEMGLPSAARQERQATQSGTADAAEVPSEVAQPTSASLNHDRRTHVTRPPARVKEGESEEFEYWEDLWEEITRELVNVL